MNDHETAMSVNDIYYLKKIEAKVQIADGKN